MRVSSDFMGSSRRLTAYNGGDNVTGRIEEEELRHVRGRRIG